MGGNRPLQAQRHPGLDAEMGGRSGGVAPDAIRLRPLDGEGGGGAGGQDEGRRIDGEPDAAEAAAEAAVQVEEAEMQPGGASCATRFPAGRGCRPRRSPSLRFRLRLRALYTREPRRGNRVAADCGPMQRLEAEASTAGSRERGLADAPDECKPRPATARRVCRLSGCVRAGRPFRAGGTLSMSRSSGLTAVARPTDITTGRFRPGWVARKIERGSMPAWVRGAAADMDAAVTAAAELLGAARTPVIAGLNAEVAAIRAAYDLAVAWGLPRHAGRRRHLCRNSALSAASGR